VTVHAHDRADQLLAVYAENLAQSQEFDRFTISKEKRCSYYRRSLFDPLSARPVGQRPAFYIATMAGIALRIIGDDHPTFPRGQSSRSAFALR
jgi:hypothetical protein